MLREKEYTSRTGATAPVAMAACIEYLCAEILEFAGNICEEDGMKRIKPSHIQKAIRGDDDLANFFANTTLSNVTHLRNVDAYVSERREMKENAKTQKTQRTQRTQKTD